jgi:transposase
MSEATATDSTGRPQRIVKGASAVVIGLAQPSPTAMAAANELEAKGFRVLAVAAGTATAMKLAGLIALSDPPRPDSAALISELHGLGVRTVMVTGDAPATAAIVAKAVGLDGAICPPGPIPDAVHPEQFAVFAGVLPEDKYKLVKAFQKGGHTIGMCGDGANDAPALRQAQMGIAVSTATDVAKSAAGIGPPTTIYNRFVRWARRGLWENLFRELAAYGRSADTQMIDSTHVKAHRSAAGATGGRKSRLWAVRAEGATRRFMHSQMLKGASKVAASIRSKNSCRSTLPASCSSVAAPSLASRRSFRRAAGRARSASAPRSWRPRIESRARSSATSSRRTSSSTV